MGRVAPLADASLPTPELWTRCRTGDGTLARTVCTAAVGHDGPSVQEGAQASWHTEATCVVLGTCTPPPAAEIESAAAGAADADGLARIGDAACLSPNADSLARIGDAACLSLSSRLGRPPAGCCAPRGGAAAAGRSRAGRLAGEGLLCNARGLTKLPSSS